MRTRLIALGSGLVLAVSACSNADSAPAALPPVQLVHPAAASAGGACILWDYAEIEEKLGVLFDVSAAGQVDDTSTCVVQAAGATLPDLMLAVVERTPADVTLYNAHLVPAQAKEVKGLGKAGYRLVSAAGKGHGPVVEVGWLTADRQLMTLRFTFAHGAGRRDGEDMAVRLVALARSLAQDDA